LKRGHKRNNKTIDRDDLKDSPFFENKTPDHTSGRNKAYVELQKFFERPLRSANKSRQNLNKTEKV